MNNRQCIHVRLNPDVLVEDLGQEAVLLNIKTEHYFGLDETGIKFWQLLQEHSNSDDVAAAVLTEYDAEEGLVYQDVTKFILQLEKAGLLFVDES